ncbi:hypothetical protein H8S90_24320 [Olivibacter sp. SDN3]|uniref:hypothetical protein n=1 Tax=Olivibacter sp. SDN3 TaxID=2764720 RepID=UPI001651ABC6|nr:hypothetical protein [Olivibacter sp. SDN3]QNL49794.1 hypothetical protein H8S90_24320 [Olivibacter sp. SDN3]
MKNNAKSKTVRKPDFPKNLKPIIKPTKNPRKQIRQLLRSFIPLHPQQEISDSYQQFPN